MHIAEGILNSEILLAGWAVSGAACAYSLWRLQAHEIPKVAMLSALFFIGSFIHIPVGPTSIHLLFNGIIGAIGGIYAFLAIFIALLFQALLYGFGGLGVLGVNTLIMALPSVLIWHFLKPNLHKYPKFISFIGGFLPVLLSVLMLVGTLLLSDTHLNYAVYMIFAFNLPLMMIEGLIAVFTLRFILKYKADFL